MVRHLPTKAVAHKVRPKVVEADWNVCDAALARFRWLVHEFADADRPPDQRVLTVSCSGGKDSTVCVEMAVRVAREEGVLPVRVNWLDQECEFAATVEYQRRLADRTDEIDFRWYQVPFRLFNATSAFQPWLHCWDPALADRIPCDRGGDGWVRAKEPDSITEFTYLDGHGHPVDRFGLLLTEINRRSGCPVISGMRAKESPARRLRLTTEPTYKWATWTRLGFLFHPIYDWSTADVWRWIHDAGVDHNAHYDHQFSWGVPLNQMRVSNYHHENAVGSLTYLQEVEPETWQAATRRLAGINTYGHIGEDLMPDTLPFMFADWTEYAEHLIDHLVQDDDIRRRFHRMLANVLATVPDAEPHRGKGARAVAKAVLRGDYFGGTVNAFLMAYRGSEPTYDG